MVAIAAKHERRMVIDPICRRTIAVRELDSLCRADDVCASVEKPTDCGTCSVARRIDLVEGTVTTGGLETIYYVRNSVRPVG